MQPPPRPDPASVPATLQELAGLTAWVTGASRGLGQAIAISLASAGADVAVTARSADALNAVQRRVLSHGVRSIAVPASIATSTEVNKAADSIVDQWGRIDVLVACAGISPAYVPAERLAESDWREVIEVNLTGTFLTAVAAGRVMLTQGSGSIITVSSIHGHHAGARLAAYCASKGGVDMLTRSLARDWTARGVRVNAVAPGYFETDMTAGLRASSSHSAGLLQRIAMGRFGSPDDLTGAVRFLAGPASAYVSGTVIEVDGSWVTG
jgi:NAD(P)-dependent dehydrogenase (short-subunit alcohol dehydrogenase family)